MNKLEELVEKLTNPELNDKEAQIKILQKINKLLLTEYVIKIGDVIIEPVLVEAYYYHKGKFDDENTHGYGENSKDLECRRLQSNRFNQLYFHQKGRGGVDICLSKGEYCLSFLIKNSLVSNGSSNTFLTQTKLHDLMKELSAQMGLSLKELENKTNVLHKKHRDYEIIHTVRKGLTTGTFKDSELASLPIEIIKNYPFTLEKDHSKTVLIRKYLENAAVNPQCKMTRAELEELRKGYISVKDFNEIFGE